MASVRRADATTQYRSIRAWGDECSAKLPLAHLRQFGIGPAVAVSLAKRGANALALVDLSESVRTVAEMINAEHSDWIFCSIYGCGALQYESVNENTSNKI